ncbi:ligand-binding sensor domain-containing protein [Leptothrix sp. BB-4]
MTATGCHRRAALGLLGGLGLAAMWPAAQAQAQGAPARLAVRHFNHFRVGNKNVKRLFLDGEVLWAGTSGGAVRHDPRDGSVRLYDTKAGLLSNGIFHVGRIDLGSDGRRLALGTYGGGLALLMDERERPPRWRTYNVPEGLGDAFVYDFLQTRDGDLWIATWSGINRIRASRLDDRRAWSLHTVDSTAGGLPNDWVYGLAEGPDGTLWLATEGGLCAHRDGQWQHWRHADGLGAPYEQVKGSLASSIDPASISQHHARQKAEMGLSDVQDAYNPNYIVSLAVDRAGVAWAGTWGAGLSRFDGQSWRHYTVADGLPGNHVFMLQIDPAGVLWVGTDQGLARMTPTGPAGAARFDVLTTHDGLYGNAVFSMTTGPDGSRWVGSYGGVARLQLQAG